MSLERIVCVWVLVAAVGGCVKPETGPNVALIEKEQQVEDRYVESQPADWAKTCEEVAAGRADGSAEKEKAVLRACQIERGL